nr:type II toxin-antitoxin system SpoIISA family toxin [Halalkalibacter oceani]
MVLFIVGNFLFFCFAPLRYHLSLRTMRKGLYSLYLIALMAGILVDEIKLSNWPFILVLTFIVVFIDIAILLTPNILKIWKAEFQYGDYVENIIITNEKRQKGTMDRVGTMSVMIQSASDYFGQIEEVHTKDEKKQQLRQYLDQYANQYGLLIQLWDFEYSPVDSDTIDAKEKQGLSDQQINELADYYGFSNGISETLDCIARLNTFDYGKEKEEYIKSLAQSGIVTLIKEDSYIVPAYMEEQNLLVVLKNDMGELLEVDGIHITNLISIYYSYV